jgi:hypothetical protein
MVISQPKQILNKKSGNWGLDKIDCHCSHKGQCTLGKENLEEKKFRRKKKFEKNNFGKKNIQKIYKKHFEQKNYEKRI